MGELGIASKTFPGKADSGPALLAREISYRTRDGRVLVDSLAIAIHDGDRLAIVGPNGAGKTTLLRMLAGLLRPHGGSVDLFGRDIRGIRPLERARMIAVVGQTDNPDGRVRLWDYVGLGRVPHSGALSRSAEWAVIRDALHRVGLEAMRDREIGTLSGGERQRAQIARALAQQPALLFLDEPTNHLDPRARSELLGLVAGLGITVVAVLHDLALVPGFATRVAVMDGGRLAACGPPSEALSPQIVRPVFGVDVLRVAHPTEDRVLVVFDPSTQQSNGA